MEIKKLTSFVFLVSLLLLLGTIIKIVGRIKVFENRKSLNVRKDVPWDNLLPRTTKHTDFYAGPEKISSRSNSTMTEVVSARRTEAKFFKDNFTITEEPLLTWISSKNTRTFCGNQFTVFAERYAIARGVKMYPSQIKDYEDKAKGGEPLHLVLGQTETVENYAFNSNLWEIPCADAPTLIKDVKKFYWSKCIKFVPRDPRGDTKNFKSFGEEMYVIAVRRQDYANLHNWVRNIYNAFLIMLHLNLQPSQITILFVDGHPFSNLDKAWQTIYNTPVRAGLLRKPVFFDNFIWGFQENQGPITEQSSTSTVPYLEQFRTFVLSRHNLSSGHLLNCRQIRITFILRRNMVYHPRNVEGNVGRKIFNEAEIVEALKGKFPNASVQTVIMESYPMKLQLDISSSTDIWIGMHGAGMSHVVFLPKHAGILELFSKDFKSGRPWFNCFHKIAKWRNMTYESWENVDRGLEMPHDFTIVPPDVVTSRVEKLVNRICQNQAQ